MRDSVVAARAGRMRNAARSAVTITVRMAFLSMSSLSSLS
jgi:hypothetical protein